MPLPSLVHEVSPEQSKGSKHLTSFLRHCTKVNTREHRRGSQLSPCDAAAHARMAPMLINLLKLKDTKASRPQEQTCHRQATVSRRFQIGFCILMLVRLVPLRTYCLKRLSQDIMWWVRYFKSSARSCDRFWGFRSHDRSGDWSCDSRLSNTVCFLTRKVGFSRLS